MGNPAVLEKTEILLSATQIQERIQELSKEIDQEYQGKEVVAICVLKGGVVFFVDMIRQMQTPVRCEFLSLSSYGDEKKSSGEVKLNLDVKFPLEGKHVIIFEDIVDSGLTLQYLKKLLNARSPASLKICSLLFKPECLKVDVKPDYLGFEIANHFVVGYGLDYAGLYRDLPYVGILNE